MLHRKKTKANPPPRTGYQTNYEIFKTHKICFHIAIVYKNGIPLRQAV